MKLSKMTWLIGGAVALIGAAPAAAATEEEVLQAVADGVAWLVANQADDGSWGGVGMTGLACKKILHHAVDPERGHPDGPFASPFDPAYPYAANAERCVGWLLSRGAPVPIGPQPAGDPDTDGDGLGVSFSGLMYDNATTLMVLCETVELDRLVVAGPLAGQTYEQVAEDLADYIYFCQNEGASPGPRGGWRYRCNDSSSDNSVTGWVSISLGFAEAAPIDGCGFTIPLWVKSELDLWVNYKQNDANGCSGYSDPNSWWNTLKQGHLLQELALLGYGADSPEVMAAVDCLCDRYDMPNQDPGWNGGPGPSSYQATFNMTKGLLSFGDALKLICDPEKDWCADFDDEIVSEQNDDGCWSDCAWGDPVLCTSWALLTLQRAVPPPPRIAFPLDIKPTSCPNPVNCRARGVLPAAILGTEDLDVTQIDPATLLLAGVAPLSWAYEDVATPYEPFTGKEGCEDCTTEGPDGFLDLTLKFDHQAIVAAIGAAEDGACVVLTIEGALNEAFGGTAIGGEDVIRFQCGG